MLAPFLPFVIDGQQKHGAFTVFYLGLVGGWRRWLWCIGPRFWVHTYPELTIKPPGLVPTDQIQPLREYWTGEPTVDRWFRDRISVDNVEPPTPPVPGYVSENTAAWGIVKPGDPPPVYPTVRTWGMEAATTGRCPLYFSGPDRVQSIWMEQADLDQLEEILISEGYDIVPPWYYDLDPPEPGVKLSACRACK